MKIVLNIPHVTISDENALHIAKSLRFAILGSMPLPADAVGIRSCVGNHFAITLHGDVIGMVSPGSEVPSDFLQSCIAELASEKMLVQERKEKE